MPWIRQGWCPEEKCGECEARQSSKKKVRESVPNRTPITGNMVNLTEKRSALTAGWSVMNQCLWAMVSSSWEWENGPLFEGFCKNKVCRAQHSDCTVNSPGEMATETSGTCLLVRGFSTAFHLFLSLLLGEDAHCWRVAQWSWITHPYPKSGSLQIKNFGFACFLAQGQ